MRGDPKGYEAQMRAIERSGIDLFKHPADVFERMDGTELVDLFEQVLRPVFVFLACGKDTKSRGLRVWVVLYVIQSPLVGSDTIRGCAKREGVSKTQIIRLIAEFRGMIPRLSRRGVNSSDNSVRNSDRESPVGGVP